MPGTAMKPDDIKDALLRHLAPPPARAAVKPAAAVSPASVPSSTIIGRVFLTDRDIRKALTPGSRDLTIAKDAIVSPLAQEWLALNGVRIVRKP